MTKEHLHESRFSDMPEEALKETIGYLASAIDNLTQEMKNDPEVVRMADALKAYKKDNFGDEIKSHKKLLKAARSIANVRGIQWKTPQ